VDKLEKAKFLAQRLENRHDQLAGAESQLALLSAPWDGTINLLHEQIRKLAEMREADPMVKTSREGLADAEQSLAEARGELFAMAEELIDPGAFFPSGKKSQVLTDRVTLKSQMPKLPTVVDHMALTEALVVDGRLAEFAKSVTVKLDNAVAEAIMRWRNNREDGNVGLIAPQPKILNIKIKPKEETE
jgi:hypothetical protein